MRRFNPAGLFKSPIDIDELFQQAQLHSQQLRWKEAIKLLSKIIKHDANFVAAYHQRSKAYVQEGNYLRAMKDIQKALELNSASAEFYHIRAVIYYQQSSREEAIKDYTHTIQLNRAYVDAYINRAIAGRDIGQALSDFEEALRLEPNNVKAYHNRGVLRLNLRENANALADFQIVVQLQPQEIKAHCQLGIAYQALEQHVAALGCFEEVMRLNNRYVPAYAQKSISLYRLGRINDAISTLRHAIELDNNNIETHYNLGIILREIKEYSASFEEFSKALHLSFVEQQLDAERKAKIDRRNRSIIQHAGHLIKSNDILLLSMGETLLEVGVMAAGWGEDLLAKAEIAAMVPSVVSRGVNIIGSVFEIGAFIIKQVKLVKANQKQCQTLADYIVIICNAVVDLNTTRNTDNYSLALNKLQDTLKECQTLIETFSQAHWFKRVLVAGTDSSRFQLVFKRFDEVIQLLQLGLIAQHFLNDEKIKQAELADREELKHNIESIIEQNNNLHQQVQGMQLDAQDRHNIMLQQFASMKEAFQTMLETSLSVNKDEFGHAPRIPFYQLCIDKKLGAGKLGIVYLGRLREETVIIKEITGLDTVNSKAQFLRESQIMSHIRSRHFALFYGICFEEERHYLVMEHFPKGNLADYLTQDLPLMERHKIAIEIAEGLRILHLAEVYHRSLSSETVFIDERGSAKLGEFGLAKVNESIAQTIKKDAYHQAITIQTLAPEQLNLRGICDLEKADIYSLGILFWELFTGKTIYSGMTGDAIIQYVLSGKRATVPKYVPLFYHNLIEQCWQTDAALRPSIQIILAELEKYKVPDAEVLHTQAMAYQKKNQLLLARQYYEQSIYCGSMRARTNLALLYCQGGDGIDKNPVLAQELFLKSAKQGHTRAMINLAQFYETGQGGEVNIEQSRFWLEKAAKLNDAEAIKRLNRLNALNSPREKPAKKPYYSASSLS